MKAKLKVRLLFLISLIFNILLIFGGALVWDIGRFTTLGGWMISVGVVVGIVSLCNAVGGNLEIEKLLNGFGDDHGY